MYTILYVELFMTVTEVAVSGIDGTDSVEPYKTSHIDLDTENL